MHEPVVVRSLAVPTIRARCPGCHGHQVFESSGLFRVNANGKIIDIWLIYRCHQCEATRNLTVVERTSVARVAPNLLERARDNDGALARSVARDVGLIRRAGAQVASGDQWMLDAGPADREAAAVALRFEEPLLVRLDKIIAAVLATTCTDLRRRMTDGSITVTATRRLDRPQLWGGDVLISRR